jgi:hypothetical protein
VKGLKDAELKMATGIVLEIAKGRGRSSDARAEALKSCRAVLADLEGPAREQATASAARADRATIPRPGAGCRADLDAAPLLIRSPYGTQPVPRITSSPLGPRSRQGGRGLPRSSSTIPGTGVARVASPGGA